MAIEGFPSPQKDNEDNEREASKPESVDDTDANSVESEDVGVGKNAEKYIDGGDAIPHQFSGPVREHLDKDTIEKLEKMKERQNSKENGDDPPEKKKAA